MTEKLVKSLSPTEKNVLPHVATGQTIEELAQQARVQPVEAMRACQFLSNKKVLTLKKQETQGYILTATGEDVVKRGLPEERFLAALDKPRSLKEIQQKAGLERDEINAAIGALKKAGAIQMGAVIEKIKDVSFEEKQAALKNPSNPPKELIDRGLLEKTTSTTHTITLTELGKALQNADLSKDYAERLTHEDLKTGAWKDKEFRHYDVTTPVPRIHFGRRHFVQDAISSIKELWVEMGFQEMHGTMTQTAFWDLDALFVPQDHPAREMQDTFYLTKPGTLPEWWQDIKAIHETGANTGSTGWQTPFSKEESQKVLLRTHTTALSAQMLRRIKKENLPLPAKYFSVAKVFRNETLDWKHLFEFHQVEGIVVGDGLSLADLIGLQKEFYKRMGFTDVRFRPAYFPYVEPGAEVEVYHPGRQQWVELGGMGVLRPEVVIPLLGKDIPVLAWGLGMERIITDYYDITDLRHIYDNDLERLRTAPAYQEKH